MKNDIFIARLAHGAVAAGIAGAWMLPQTRTQAPEFSLPEHEAIIANLAPLPEEKTETAANTAMVLTISQTPSEWDKKLEKEFRGLALAEAKGTLSATQGQRLEELNHMRNQLLNGMTAGEISVQLKRDRLLAQMENLLTKYVEFQEATGQKRALA
jgi:hypothetical protein